MIIRLGITSRGVLKPKPTLRVYRSARPVLLALAAPCFLFKKIVGCFWKERSYDRKNKN
jgi:hypothetical protein